MAAKKQKQANKPSWRHYNFTTAGPVDDYLYSMLPKRDAVLAEMEDYATQHNVPIVGPAVARVLQQLAMMINAGAVFELGSAIGRMDQAEPGAGAEMATFVADLARLLAEISLSALMC